MDILKVPLEIRFCMNSAASTGVFFAKSEYLIYYTNKMSLLINDVDRFTNVATDYDIVLQMYRLEITVFVDVHIRRRICESLFMISSARVVHCYPVS